MTHFTVLILVLFGTGLGVSYGNPNERILGGNETDIENYPYALQLFYMDQLECGGILVSERFALTAGHCIARKTVEYFLIRAGTTTLGEGGQTFTISQTTYHPQFNLSHNNYDAVVLLLSETVSVSTAKPIQLATDDSAIIEGGTILVAGWGWTILNTKNEFSTTLRVTDLTILGDEECKNSYDTPVITDAMFCGNYSGTKIRDFCFGDYGGPAVIDGILQGIISFGESCGDGYNGKVFVRISIIREWVLNIIQSID
ncbi:trypsin-7-like [Anoplophora glabripennis]|uniref:trypsin-7-like n=1 Tax=Anoplophora glabripennis TaxID=217634 RepID=UPI000874B790|nr:trypsin-7-like [Anoplophora glabripennis]